MITDFQRKILALVRDDLESYASGLEYSVVKQAACGLLLGSRFNPALDKVREAEAKCNWVERGRILSRLLLAVADGQPDAQLIRLLICLRSQSSEIVDNPTYDYGTWLWLRSWVRAAGLEKEFPAVKEPEYVPPPPRDPDATTWVEDDYEGSVGYGPSVLG